PDGPRGPCEEAKPGVVHLAKATGAPIFPVSYAASRCIRLGSWDRMMIPLPFSRVTFAVEEAIRVPRRAQPEELEGLRQQLQERLVGAGDAAQQALAS